MVIIRDFSLFKLFKQYKKYNYNKSNNNNNKQSIILILKLIDYKEDWNLGLFLKLYVRIYSVNHIKNLFESTKAIKNLIYINKSTI